MPDEPGTSPQNRLKVETNPYYEIARSKPVGTVQELEELGQDVHEWATCARPEGGPEGIRGCDQHRACIFSNWKGKNGAHYVGVRLAKKGSAVKHKIAACYDYMKEDHPRRVEGRRVVAHEGEYVPNRWVVPVSPSVVGNNPDKRTKVVWVDELVPFYPRPKESMAALVGAEQAFEEIAEAAAEDATREHAPKPSRRGAPGQSAPKQAEES